MGEPIRLTPKEVTIAVEFPDRTVWEFPAMLVADARARYYDDKEPGCYEEEYEYTINSDEELLDWASNNMDWKHVMSHARLIDRDTTSDYNEWWVNADREVMR